MEQSLIFSLCRLSVSDEYLDKLGTDPMAYGGFNLINGRRRGIREESRK